MTDTQARAHSPTPARTFVDGEGRRARVVIGEGETRDELQISEAWLASRHAADLQDWQ